MSQYQLRTFVNGDEDEVVDVPFLEGYIQGPSGSVEFFTKLGFEVVKPLGSDDILVRLQL